MRPDKIWQTERVWVGALLILFLALLLLPGVLRLHAGAAYFSDDASYYYLDSAVHDSASPLQLSALGSHAGLYTLLLESLASIMTLRAAMMVLPLVLGLIAFFLSYSLIRKYFTGATRNLMILLAATAPLLLFLFTQLQPLGLAWVLLLGGLRLFVGRSSSLAFLCFAPLPLLDIPFAIVSVLLALAISIRIRDKIRSFYLILAATVLSGLWYMTAHQVLIASFFQGATPWLAELGAPLAITLPFLILGLIGFFSSWKQDTSRYLLQAVFIISIALSFSIISMRLLVLGFLIAYAALGIRFLLDREWSFSLIRQVTFLLIACSLLFSLVAFITDQVQAPSTADYLEAFTTLKDYQDAYPQLSGVVLAPERLAYVIQYRTGLETIPPGIHDSSFLADQARTDAQMIYASRSYLNTSRLLDSLNISYIFIDSIQRQAVWQDQVDGLYFLLLNSDAFVLIYENPSIQVFRYSPEERSS